MATRSKKVNLKRLRTAIFTMHWEPELEVRFLSPPQKMVLWCNGLTHFSSKEAIEVRILLEPPLMLSWRNW